MTYCFSEILFYRFMVYSSIHQVIERIMKTVAVANFAGGQCKTTLAYLLASLLSKAGNRVLLVDADPQGNSTLFAGVDVQPQNQTLLEVLRDGAISEEALMKSPIGFDVIAADRGLAQAEYLLSSSPTSAIALKRALTAVQDRYDFVIVDSAPQGLNLSQTAICAAESVFIPAETAWKGVEGAIKTLNTLEELAEVGVFRGQVVALVPFRDRHVGNHRVIACREPMEALEALAESRSIPLPIRVPECSDFSLALSEQRMPKTACDLGLLTQLIKVEVAA